MDGDREVTAFGVRTTFDELNLAFHNFARTGWCSECLTIHGRFSYWLHRRAEKHRPLTLAEWRRR